MKKISIIIPVYNIAPYIERCITSIINQEPSDLEAEIILVDDGSTDESGSICDKISEEHHNVSVIHQQNAGQSDARNNGLKKATGDYIWFVDGDDYIDAESFKNICISSSNFNPDIINIGYKKLYKNGETSNYISDLSKNHKISDGITALSQLGAIPTWTAIYNRDFLNKNELLFVKGIIHEDFEFGIRSHSLAKEVLFVPKALYIYCCDRAGSTENTMSAQFAIGYAYSSLSVDAFFKTHNFSQADIRKILRVVAIGIVFSLRIMSTLNNNYVEYKKVIQFYRHNKRSIAKALSYLTLYYKFIGILFKIDPLISHKIFMITNRLKNTLRH